MRRMQIALAQVQAKVGDVALNIVHHLRFAERAAAHGAGCVLFPELSLTGYEPALCRRLAIDADEDPFFTPGPRAPFLLGSSPRIGLAICYELSVAAHAEATFAAGAQVYCAAVAKTARGVAAAHERLAAVARQFAAPVLMVNCVGPGDGALCAGGSAAWNRRGERLAALDDVDEGLLVFDAETARAAIVAGTS